MPAEKLVHNAGEPKEHRGPAPGDRPVWSEPWCPWDHVNLLMRKWRATLNEGVVVVRADQPRSEPGIRDAEGLARAIRRVAIEAHKILNCPDARIGELIQVRRQFQELRGEACGLSAQPTELDRWLRSAHSTIETKLRSGLGVARGLLAS
jgi:hypothetical protein